MRQYRLQKRLTRYSGPADGEQMPYGDMPSASVIVPTYNRSTLLRRTLDSLERQRADGCAFEVVVADDGSSDDSRAVAEEFAERLPVRYVFQQDEGYRAAAARNSGARIARGDALIFLDSGTLAGPDFVTGHVRALSAASSGSSRNAVIGYAYGYNPWDTPPDQLPDLGEDTPAEIVARLGADPNFRDMRERIFETIGDDTRKLHVPWMLFWTMNVSVRAEDFRAVGGFDEDFRSWGCEDVELGYRLARAGVGLVVSRDAWAIESPHDRDVPGIKASNARNSMLLWSKHQNPTMEMYWAIYGNDAYEPSLEEAYGDYARWLAASAGTRVADEVRECVSGGVPDGSRVLVVGADREFEAPPGALHWTALCADDEIGDRNADLAVDHALGLRTAYPEGRFDLVVLTSRLADLWPLWGKHLMLEAERVGASVVLTRRLRNAVDPA